MLPPPKTEFDAETTISPQLGIFTRLLNNQLTTIVIILFLMIFLLGSFTRTFLTANNIFNVLRAFSWIAIASFGQSMVIIGGGIDLSSGSTMAFARCV